MSFDFYASYLEFDYFSLSIAINYLIVVSFKKLGKSFETKKVINFSI